MNLAVGQKATRSLTLTEDHVAAYAEMTGDYNPLHFDPDFAARTKFGKLVVQLKITITRQTGEIVLEGEAWCYTFSPED